MLPGETALRGWGPDYTDITATCPVPGCPWEHDWNDSVTLAEVNGVVKAHFGEKHGEH